MLNRTWYFAAAKSSSQRLRKWRCGAAVTECVDREKKPNRDENNALKLRLSPRSSSPPFSYTAQPQFNISFYAPMGNENCSYLRKPTRSLRSLLAIGLRGIQITEGVSCCLLSFRTLFRSHRTKNVGVRAMHSCLHLSGEKD